MDSFEAVLDPVHSRGRVNNALAIRRLCMLIEFPPPPHPAENRPRPLDIRYLCRLLEGPRQRDEYVLCGTSRDPVFAGWSSLWGTACGTPSAGLPTRGPQGYGFNGRQGAGNSCSPKGMVDARMRCRQSSCEISYTSPGA